MEKFNEGSLGEIGGETERTTKNHRNQDIDDERTPLNFYFKKSDGGLRSQWKKTVKELNATFKQTKKSVAFEGMIITSDTAKYEWEKKQQERELKANSYSLEIAKTELALTKRKTAEEKQSGQEAHEWAERETEKAQKAIAERKEAEQANAKLTADNEQLKAENKRLSEQAEPLGEYLAAFEEAKSGDLPLSPVKLRKMVVGLTAKYKELEAEKKIGDRDKEYIFKELRDAEQRIPELERYRDFVSLLHTYAPDELATAKQIALDRRDAPYKNSPRTNGKNGNYK